MRLAYAAAYCLLYRRLARERREHFYLKAIPCGSRCFCFLLCDSHCALAELQFDLNIDYRAQHRMTPSGFQWLPMEPLKPLEPSESCGAHNVATAGRALVGGLERLSDYTGYNVPAHRRSRANRMQARTAAPVRSLYPPALHPPGRRCDV